jgi:hypothetical protein
MATKHRGSYVETSAKSGAGVSKLFETLGRIHVEAAAGDTGEKGKPRSRSHTMPNAKGKPKDPSKKEKDCGVA